MDSAKSQRRAAMLASHLQPEQPTLSQQPAAGKTAAPVAAPGRRAVLVMGARTPFLKSFGNGIEEDAIDLGVAAVSGLLKKSKLDPNLIDEVIWGNVVLNTSAPNVAREIVIDLNLPAHIPGVTVSRACLSGLSAILAGVQAIEHGTHDIVIAGGSDSTSNGEMPLPRRVTHALARYTYGKNKGLPGVQKMLREAGPVKGWFPKGPSIAERSTGKTMGYHADLMAEINSVSRNEQDNFAMSSHRKAAAAAAAGKLAEEIVPVTTKKGLVLNKDEFIRGKQDPAKMQKLRPAFRKTGTITAASSSPLTDGAAAVLIMSEEKARELGYPTDISFKAFATTAIDPFPQLLLAPALAIPRVLDAAGVSLEEVDIVEMHEAFAAQCLATIKCLESDEFGRKTLGRSGKVGRLPLDKVNPNGSSIATGHPFAATGARITTAGMNELRRSGKKYCLLSVCAAGGLGGAALIERRDE